MLLCVTSPETGWWQESRAWSYKVNLTDFSTPSLHHYYGKCIGTTNENLNFDIRVKTDNLKKGQKPGMQSTGGGRSGSPWPHPHKSSHFHAPATQARTYNPSSSIFIFTGSISPCCRSNINVVFTQHTDWAIPRQHQLVFNTGEPHCARGNENLRFAFVYFLPRPNERSLQKPRKLL